MILKEIFAARQMLRDENHQGEISVLCPFKHSQGYEKNPSAHINEEKGVFHCKTCRAEGRFNDGGLGAVQFIKEYFGMTDKNASAFYKSIECIDEKLVGSWYDGIAMLNKSDVKKEILIDKRGLTEETIKTYRLAYHGGGIMYPVSVFGTLCDVRSYNFISDNGIPKMMSEKGAQPLIFPFDHWYKDERPTVLVGGENDALIGRQLGFNAITFTGGEGAIPRNGMMDLFRGKTVYLCYDCDDAGRTAVKRVAYFLKKAGADVYVIDLGLPGTKESKDISDYVNREGKTSADFEQLMKDAKPFTEEHYQVEKDREFPLVDLWNATDARYTGKLISSRTVMAGKYDMDFQVESERTWGCYNYNAEAKKCQFCAFANADEERGIRKLDWKLDEQSKDIMYLIEQNEEVRNTELKKMAGINPKCTSPFPIGQDKHIRAQKATFVPEVDTNHELSGFLATEIHGYILNEQLIDGESYRIYYRPYPHPTQRGRMFLLITDAETSDNAVSRFKVTPAIYDELKQFQGDPVKVMQDRHKLTQVVVDASARESIVNCTNLVYHSPLKMKFMGRSVKGYSEIAMIGETRTGKSSVTKGLQGYYGMGNRASMKTATLAGLIGGAEKQANGVWRIKWGDLVRNNRGMMILDEMSGLDANIMAKMTDVRSEGKASQTKMGGTTVAPANTRLLWAGNQRVIKGRSIPFSSYANGIAIVLDLFGAAEDIARFDAIALIAESETRIKPTDRPDFVPASKQACKHLVQWCWSRKEDQILWGEDVENFIWDASEKLNRLYNSDVKILGSEAHLKLARLAVATAATCFSCDETGECILVEKEHVEWAVNFLHSCYDNEIFRLREYVEESRIKNELTADVENVVKKLMHSDDNVMLIRELVGSSEPIHRSGLEQFSGMDRMMFSKMISYMARHHLVENTSHGIVATQRFKKAYRKLKDTGIEDTPQPILII